MEAIRELADALARWSLYALALVAPVFFIPGGYATIPQAKLILVAGVVAFAAAMWFISSFADGVARIPRHTIVFTTSILPLAYVISSFFAGWPTSAVVSGLGEQDTVVTIALWFSSLLVAALVMGRDVRVLITFVRALVIGMFALLVFQVARLFYPAMLTFGGTFPNQTTTAAGSWHDLGIVLAFAVIFCGALLYTRLASDGIWRWLFGLTAVLSFLFLVVSSMQDVWFVLAAASAVFGVYAWFAAGNKEGVTTLMRGLRAGVWILVASAAFILGWYSVVIHDHLPAPLQVVSIEVRPSWEGTYQIGENSLTHAGKESLIFGAGPNSFAHSWALYKPPTVNTTLFWNLDFNSGVGLVPTSFVTIGILGVLAWALVFLGFLFSAGKALLATRPFDSVQTTVFAFIAGILLLVAFHIMYAPGPLISALLFLLLGAFVALPISETPRPTFKLHYGLDSVGHFASFILAGGLTVLVLLVTVTGSRALASDVYVNRGVAVYTASGATGDARGYIERSLQIWPNNDRAHRAAVELGILELAQLAQNTSADDAAKAQLQATLSKTIEHGLTAVSLDGTDYQNWLTLAQLYQELAGAGIEGAYEQAQAAYTSARKENPTNPLPLVRLAQLESIRGNNDAAIKDLDEAIALKKDYAIGYFMRSQLLAQKGQLDPAVESAAIAVQLVPQDPLGWYNLGSILYLGQAWAEAASVFSQAVTLRPDYSNAIFLLGLSLHNVGNNDQALLALERVRQLNPNDATVPVVMENIRSGKQPFEGLSQQ